MSIKGHHNLISRDKKTVKELHYLDLHITADLFDHTVQHDRHKHLAKKFNWNIYTTKNRLAGKTILQPSIK